MKKGDKVIVEIASMDKDRTCDFKNAIGEVIAVRQKSVGVGFLWRKSRFITEYAIDVDDRIEWRNEKELVRL